MIYPLSRFTLTAVTAFNLYQAIGSTKVGTDFPEIPSSTLMIIGLMPIILAAVFVFFQVTEGIREIRGSGSHTKMIRLYSCIYLTVLVLVAAFSLYVARFDLVAIGLPDVLLLIATLIPSLILLPKEIRILFRS